LFRSIVLAAAVGSGERRGRVRDRPPKPTRDSRVAVALEVLAEIQREILGEGATGSLAAE
jgi:hypothetical protein